jgi:hypothetical protein
MAAGTAALLNSSQMQLWAVGGDAIGAAGVSPFIDPDAMRVGGYSTAT